MIVMKCENGQRMVNTIGWMDGGENVLCKKKNKINWMGARTGVCVQCPPQDLLICNELVLLVVMNCK